MYDSIRIEEMAAAWLARRDSDSWSAADQKEFDVWLEASIAHRVACLRLEVAWQEARRLKAIAAAPDGGP